MKEQTILAVKVSPDKEAELTHLKNDLDSLQKVVSEGAPCQGLIECVHLDHGVDILCNDEGKLQHLKPCRRLEFDIIVGTFYVVGANKETGEFVSLTKEQADKYLAMFKEPENISQDEVNRSVAFSFVPF